MDLLETTVEEIALEGLDGITLETLWFRLQQDPLNIRVDSALKEYIWRGLRKSTDVDFFQVPQERSFDGTSKYPYPIRVVDGKDGNFGSCQDYSTRKNISAAIRGSTKSCVETSTEYGAKMVIVASQELRCKCLTDSTIPLKDFLKNIQPVHYAMLERIGRSRCCGAFVTGKKGLATLFHVKPKDLHYILQNVLTEQLGLIAREIVNENRLPDTCATSVAFLARFYKNVFFGGKAVAGANNQAFHKIVTFLESQKNHRAPLLHVQKLCNEVGVPYKHWIKRYPSHFTTYGVEISRKEFDKLKAEAQAYREGKPHVQQEGSSSSSEEEEVLEEFFPAEGESKDETLTESRADSSLSKLSARGKKKTWSVRMIELINPGSTVLGSTGKPLTPVIKRIRSMPEFAKEGSPQSNSQSVKTSESVVNLLNVDSPSETVEEKEVEEVTAEDEKSNSGFDDAIDVCRNFHPLHSMAYEIMQSVRASGSEGMSIRDLTANHVISDKTLERPLKVMVDSGRLKLINVLEGRAKSRKYVCAHVETLLKAELDRFSELSGGVVLDPNSATEEEATSSDRHVKRLNMILEYLQQNKVTLTTVPLSKNLAARELDEGYPHKIDKRQLLKLLEFLKSKELVKQYQTTLKSQPVSVFCERSIAWEDAIVQQAIAEARMTQVAIHPKKEGYLVGDRIPRKRPNRTKKQSDSEKSSEEETSDGEETEKGEKDLVDWKKTKKLSDLMTYHPKAGVQYGVQSKMLRLQIFHQFLYYVVYGYRGTGPAFKDKFTTKICRAVPAVSIETTEKVDQSGWDRRDIFYVMPDSKDKNDEMEVAKPTMEVEPHVYLKEIGWQRYIPPLEPVYDLQSQPLQQGWFMLNDVILAMPLSIFVLIMPLCYKIEGLEDWLAHPVRRHTLLADLPVILRRMLTFANKHIATLSHHCALLNVMNLLANGPCKFTPNNRSKAFYCFYLRKNASVWDTSISEPQFLFVTQPMEQYKEYRYNFEDMDTVELFWHHLTAVSISTRLGHRLKVSEEERAALKRFDRRTKESTLFRISTGTFDEVNRWIAEDSFPSPLSVDVEIKPGAAGTHPLLFMYRPACWGWNRTPLNRWICDIWIERKALFADEVVSRCENVTSAWRSQVHSRLKFTQRWFAGSRCPVSSRLRLPRNRTKGTSEVDPGAFEETMENTITTAAAEESVTVPKRKRAKREAYFHVRPRNEFSKREIYMLVLIKAVNHVLAPTAKLCVSPTIFKELMDKYCEESRDKPLSCLHRMANRLLSSKRQIATMMDFVEMINMNPDIMELKNSLTTITTTLDEATKTNVFTTFFNKVWSIFSKDTVHSLPDSVEEVQRLYKLELFRKPGLSDDLNSDPSQVGQIRRAVLHNIVYANYSLLKKDGQFAVQLRNIYDQFSDADLDATVKGLVKRGILLGETKRRWNPSEKVSAGERGDLVFSHYFRHFFYQKFYLQLERSGLEQILSLTTPVTDPTGERDGVLDWAEVNISSTPASLATISSFLLKKQIDLRVKPPPQLIPVDQLCDGEADSSSNEPGEKADTTSNKANMSYLKYRMDRILSRLRTERLRATDPQNEAESVNFGPSRKITASMWSVHGRFAPESSSDQPTHSYLFDPNEPPRASKVFEDLDNLRNVGWHKKKRKHNVKRTANYSSFYVAENRAEISRSFNKFTQPHLCQSALAWLERYMQATEFSTYWYCDAMDLGSEATMAADLVEKEFWAELPESIVEIAQKIYKPVSEAKSVGMTIEELQKLHINRDIKWDDAWESLIMDGLLETVGIVQFRYVSFRHAIPWLVKTVKISKDQRAAASAELNEVKEESDLPLPSKRRKVDEAPGSSSPKIVSSSAISKIGTQVIFAPKPWIRPDGSLNRSMLRWVAEGIFLHIIANPGISETALAQKFSQALQMCSSLEVAEFLVALKCVSKRVTNVYTRSLLFGPKVAENKMISYEATPDGLLRFHVAFEKTPPPDFAVDADVKKP